MKSHRKEREKQIINLSRTHRWYEYERYKKYPSSPNKETEAKSLVKNLRL